MEKNGRTLDANTEKGRENRDNLRNIAEAALLFSENLTGIDQIDFLKNARRAFIDGAEKAGGMDRASRDVVETIDALIRKLKDADGQDVDVDVDVHTTAAERRLAEFLNRPRKLSIQAQVDSIIDLVGVPGVGGKKKPKLPAVVGGIGPLFSGADGGFTGRGGKYDVAGIVHRGEVVIPADRAQRDRGLLMGRYGDLPGMSGLPGMATGGLAGNVPPTWTDVGMSSAREYGVPTAARSTVASVDTAGASSAGDGPLVHELRSANARLAAIEKTIHAEHDADRRSMRAGAGAIARSRPRGQMPS